MAHTPNCIVTEDRISSEVAMVEMGHAFRLSSIPSGGHWAAAPRTVKYAPNSAEKNTHSDATNRTTPSRGAGIGSRRRATGAATGAAISALTRASPRRAHGHPVAAAAAATGDHGPGGRRHRRM